MPLEQKPPVDTWYVSKIEIGGFTEKHGLVYSVKNGETPIMLVDWNDKISVYALQQLADKLNGKNE